MGRDLTSEISIEIKPKLAPNKKAYFLMKHSVFIGLVTVSYLKGWSLGEGSSNWVHNTDPLIIHK